MKLIRYSIAALLLSFSVITIASAATTGTIDPNNLNDHYAAFVHAPTGGSAEINFGKFTTATSDDITISGGALHGYAWSPVVGWISMKSVSVDNNGVLSGYAWGQQTGWINFGPFVNNTTPQIKIGSNGNFGGTTGTAGYAWSQSYGWIVFDCSNPSTCVNTDYTTVAQSSSGGGGGGSASGSTTFTWIPPLLPQALPPIVAPIKTTITPVGTGILKKIIPSLVKKVKKILPKKSKKITVPAEKIIPPPKVPKITTHTPVPLILRVISKVLHFF